MSWFMDFDWTLFASALVSSTLLPGGSEALLAYRIQAEPERMLALVWVATLGNVLGSLITYGMGRVGAEWGKRKLHISEDKVQRAEQHFRRFGTPALLFAWLPVVGDPLCFVAGTLRYHPIAFLALVSIGKLARYGFVAWTTLSLTAA